jgi:hypothetical protein
MEKRIARRLVELTILEELGELEIEPLFPNPQVDVQQRRSGG